MEFPMETKYLNLVVMIMKNLVDQININMDNQQALIDVIGQHIGLAPKQEAPTTKAFSNEGHGPHTLFVKTKPSPFLNNNSWHHFPKVDMRKFDGSNPSGWVTLMEHYFSLHDIYNDFM